MAVTPWRARDRLRRRVVPKVGNRRTDWPVYKAILFNLNDKKVKFPSSERSVEKPPDCQRSNESAVISKSNNISSSGSVNGSGNINTSNGNAKSSTTTNNKASLVSLLGPNRARVADSVDVREYKLVLKRGLRKFSDMSEADDLLDRLISNFEARFSGQLVWGESGTGAGDNIKPTPTKKLKRASDKPQMRASLLGENKQLTNSCWEQVVKDKAKLIEMHAF